MTRLACLAATVVGLTFVGSAQALFVGGGGFSLVIEADSDEVNQITIDALPRNIFGEKQWDIREARANEISTRDFCDRDLFNARRVICHTRPDNAHGCCYVADFRVGLGDLDDSLTVRVGMRAIANGDSGDDTIYGGTGKDDLSGDSGDDSLSGRANDDNLYGGSGEDELYGGANDDRLRGDKGDDLLKGGTGSDDLVGGPGSDVLYGQSGDDTIDTVKVFPSDQDGKRDVVHCGSGEDTVVAKTNDSVGTDCEHVTRVSAPAAHAEAAAVR